MSRVIIQQPIISDGNIEYILVFQIYGAILIADLLKVLKDGEVKKCYFIGYAFSEVFILWKIIR